MQFGKDFANRYWYSKLNFLAMECAKYKHDIRFFDPASNDITVVQCDSGLVTAPIGILNKRYILVLHDWCDKYLPYVDRALRIICLGVFEHPKFIKHTDTLPSFPIDKTMFPVPHNPYDLIIGGMMDNDSDVDYVMSNVTDSDQNIMMCTYTDGVPDAEQRMIDIVTKLGERKQIFVRPSLNDVMIRLAYRSSRKIIHCGSGTRGLLHTLGVFSGNTIITKSGDNEFTPADLQEFISLLK